MFAALFCGLTQDKQKKGMPTAELARNNFTIKPLTETYVNLSIHSALIRQDQLSLNIL